MRRGRRSVRSLGLRVGRVTMRFNAVPPTRAASRGRRVDPPGPQTAKSRSSAISSEKMPSASVTAKPKISRGELAVGRGRIADRAGEIVAEERADADARAAHADTGDTGSDQLCCIRFHVKTPCVWSIGLIGLSATDGSRRSGTCRSGSRRHRPAGRRRALRAPSAPRSSRTGGSRRSSRRSRRR